MSLFTSLLSFTWPLFNAFSAHIPYPVQHTVGIQKISSTSDSPFDLATCSIPKDVRVQAKIPSPFIPLSFEELEDIKQWLYHPERKLNLTSTANKNLTQTDNYIWIIETLFPNKTDALPYLDGHSPIPDRFARVVINEGGKHTPVVTEYFVRSLPINSKTSIKTLDYFYSRSARVPFNARVLDQPRFDAIDEAVAKIMSSIADITLNLTGLQYFGKHDPRTNTEYYPASKSPTSMEGTARL